MPETLFIADLHLDRDRPHSIASFAHFLETDTPGTDALYILGDLFEYWLGDDDPAEDFTPATQGLKAASEAGLEVHFMPGNRDFLVGQRFAHRTGCRLLGESEIIDLYGQPTLIMHGDTLCTDDVAYQSFRRKIRHPLVQRTLLSLTLRARKRIAEYLRRKSRQAMGLKPPAIMDVNQQTVEQVMRANGVLQLIHGHTHRPAIHRFELDGRNATRLVLGDWYEQGNVLRCDEQGCRLTPLV